MNILLAIIEPFLLAFLVGLFLSYAVYFFRKNTVKSEKQMLSFLDERFALISTQGLRFKRKRTDYIDKKSIRNWGYSGWAFIGLAAINIDISAEKIMGLGNISAFVLLFFTGLIVGDSRSALFFLQKLNYTQYKPIY